MRLTVRDTAQLFGVSEKTLYRWVSEGKIPAYRINDQYRFARSEVLEWAMANRVALKPGIFLETREETGPLPSLEEALEAGGIVYRVEGQDRDSALFSIVRSLRLPPEVDKEYVYELLRVREMLGSTGIGEGIAVPHPRSPLIFNLPHASLTLSFLENPIDFGALDEKPVFATFTILSLTVRGHIHLMSRLAHVLKDSRFRKVIREQGSREAIFAELSRAEQAMMARTD